MDLHHTLLSIAPNYLVADQWFGSLMGGLFGFILGIILSGAMTSPRLDGSTFVFCGVCALLCGIGGGNYLAQSDAQSYASTAEAVLKTDFTVEPAYDNQPDFIGGTYRKSDDTPKSGKTLVFAISGIVHHPAVTQDVLGKPVTVPAYDEPTKTFVVSPHDAELLRKALLASADPATAAAAQRLASAR